MNVFVGLCCALASLHLQTAETFPIVSRLSGDDLARREISVDLIARPATEEVSVFAGRVVEAEGLVSWDDKPMMEMTAENGLSFAGVTAGNGRNVSVVYLTDRPDSLLVCRIRARTTAFDHARYRAARWCAGQLGVELPEQPSPPIIVDS
ncbi:MAG: hypothetical protein PSV23_02715 [Brevundimonas sp.]|uniref:hypothetical protein n=1 Tax=Brevundimonas sp. TaxID=1871086 RepID=UPI002489068B|nr:hypothetical protein [Brevundimonas sp.]MDI1325690.1 hypothetical protein [Brevundimonas sp.]